MHAQQVQPQAAALFFLTLYFRITRRGVHHHRSARTPPRSAKASAPAPGCCTASRSASPPITTYALPGFEGKCCTRPVALARAAVSGVCAFTEALALGSCSRCCQSPARGLLDGRAFVETRPSLCFCAIAAVWIRREFSRPARRRLLTPTYASEAETLTAAGTPCKPSGGPPVGDRGLLAGWRLLVAMIAIPCPRSTKPCVPRPPHPVGRAIKSVRGSRRDEVEGHHRLLPRQTDHPRCAA